MIAAIFTAFFKGSQSATYKIKAEAEEEARLVQNQAWVKIEKGRQREQIEVYKPVDVKKRTDFE